MVGRKVQEGKMFLFSFIVIIGSFQVEGADVPEKHF
jgi:hypothetical protein